MTYYKVSQWRNEIEPVEFSKVTEHFGMGIGYNGRERRVKLHSEYEAHFPTREEAVSYALWRLTLARESLASKLADATEQLAEFEQREGLA